MDWRERGIVGPLVDHTRNTTYNGKEYTCSATYAIVTAEAVAAFFARKTGQIAPLSVQQLIDCTSDIRVMEKASKGGEINNGCLSGRMSAVYAYTTAFPLFTARSYPYKGFEERCRQDAFQSAGVYNVKGKSYQIAGWEVAKSGDSSRVKQLL